MKRFNLWTGMITAMAATLALALAFVPSAVAQVGTHPTNQSPANRPDQSNQYQQHQDSAMHRDMSHKDACKASEIIGLNVRAKTGDDNIGEIKDLMISHDGRVEYVAVSFGGFLGLGDKLFAVPLEAIEFEKAGAPDTDEGYARIDVTEQTLRNKKGFNEDNWPEKADSSFRTANLRRPGNTTASQ